MSKQDITVKELSKKKQELEKSIQDKVMELCQVFELTTGYEVADVSIKFVTHNSVKVNSRLFTGL